MRHGYKLLFHSFLFKQNPPDSLHAAAYGIPIFYYKEPIVMRDKKSLGIAALIILIGGAVVFVVWRLQLRSAHQEIKEIMWTPSPTSVNKLPPGAEPGFEWVQYQGEETWHKVPIEKKKPVVHPPAPPPKPVETKPASRDYKPTRVEIPEGITDPEVQKAWERVEYIANNIWEWGGVPSHRTEELIDQLMPPPVGFSGPTGDSDLEETFDLLGRLDTNDPRSAEVLATYLCEGLVGGLGPENMLVDIGVPAVPYLIPYMLDMELMPVLRSYPIVVLGRIAAKHRADLGGIVDYILIPRWEAILSQEKPNYHEEIDAREALARLK